nr:MAG TPA: hypothetical protein [Caudoviricetes sp.]
MILMIILIVLSITLLVLYLSLFRGDPFFLAMSIIFTCFTISMGILCGELHSKNGIENTKYELNCEYVFLLEHEDSTIHLDRITNYNAKIIHNKALLNSVWTNWFVSPAYDDAKLIGEENENDQNRN